MSLVCKPHKTHDALQAVLQIALLHSQVLAEPSPQRMCVLQFTPKVTELVLAELFFLSIDRANQPINVYVHSFGTQTPNKQVRSRS